MAEAGLLRAGLVRLVRRASLGLGLIGRLRSGPPAPGQALASGAPWQDEKGDDQGGGKLPVRGQGLWEVLQPQLQLQGAHGNARREARISVPLPGWRLQQAFRAEDGLATASPKRAHEGEESQVRLLRPPLCAQGHFKKVEAFLSLVTAIPLYHR